MANKYSFLKDTIIGRKSKDYLVPGSSAAKQYNKMFGATPTQQKQYMNEAIKSSLMLAGGNAMLKNPIKKPIALGADTIPGTQRLATLPSTIQNIKNTLLKFGGKIYNRKTGLGASLLGIGAKSVGGAKDFYEENKETTPEQSSAIPTYTPSGPSDAGGKVYGPRGGSTSTQVQSYIDKYKDRKADDIEYTGTKTSSTYVKRTPEERRALMKEKNPNMIGTKEKKMWQGMIDTYAEQTGKPVSTGVPLRKDIETFKAQMKTLPKEDVEKLIANYKAKNI